jgi:hypothetical protein
MHGDGMESWKGQMTQCVERGDLSLSPPLLFCPLFFFSPRLQYLYQIGPTFGGFLLCHTAGYQLVRAIIFLPA